MRLLAVVEYDGTDLSGFQLQAHRHAQHRTVQAELERALAACTGEHVRVIGSGRTDAGVHARGQVIHFDTNAPVASSPRSLLRAVNAHLPDDVKLRAIAPVPAEFHARFSAASRTYCYRIWCGESPSPLARRQTHHVRHLLHADRMAEGASYFLGTHDFVAFTAQEAPGSTTRQVIRAQVAQTWANPARIWHTSVNGTDVSPKPDDAAALWRGITGSGDAPGAGDALLVEIEVEASGFLRHM
ncbi:MAG TPA: tRNA pseudouridine synthase A, partial [Chloroflexota bacterium]|nr:tRNA pseudouridine synthase A [Chloroflexota bacterium]